MSILFLLILGFLIYSNARLAASKGRNPAAWVLISIVAYFISYAFLATFYLALVYKGEYTQEALISYLQNNPMTGLLVVLLGISGVLGVRYYLEKSASRREGEH